MAWARSWRIASLLGPLTACTDLGGLASGGGTHALEGGSSGDAAIDAGPAAAPTADANDATADATADTTTCVPKTCQELGKNCDAVSDGCGSMLGCGSCPSTETCGGGGTANVCGAGPTCSGITGPASFQVTAGFHNEGLAISATRDTTLTSFVFNNQGLADTVRLINTADGSVVYSIMTPPGQAAFTATVSWALKAGTSYQLVSVDSTGANGTFEVGGPSLPIANGSIDITGNVNFFTGMPNVVVSFARFSTCP